MIQGSDAEWLMRRLAGSFPSLVQQDSMTIEGHILARIMFSLHWHKLPWNLPIWNDQIYKTSSQEEGIPSFSSTCEQQNLSGSLNFQVYLQEAPKQPIKCSEKCFLLPCFVMRISHWYSSAFLSLPPASIFSTRWFFVLKLLPAKGFLKWVWSSIFTLFKASAW